jgi:MFS family permease
VSQTSGWIGSALEYYDFALYSLSAALIFPAIFFPSENPTVAIIASLATYAVGYVSRPVGAVVLGAYGDRHGRKQVLVLAMLLMGFATFAVGLLPTYGQVGIRAPVLLVILRLIQARHASRFHSCHRCPPGSADVPAVIGLITFGISLAAALATVLSPDTKGKSLEDLET